MRPQLRPGENGTLWLGLLLLVLGLVFLGAIFVPQGVIGGVGHLGWPLLIVVPGVTLIVVGMTTDGVSGLCIPGGILTVLGVVLGIQNGFDLYSAWAYAWALVAPGGVGLGIWLQGIATASPALRASGVRLMATGALLFLGFAAFFEGLLHISGRDFGVVGQAFLPAVLILFGVLLLLRRALPAGAGSAPRSGPTS